MAKKKTIKKIPDEKIVPLAESKTSSNKIIYIVSSVIIVLLLLAFVFKGLFVAVLVNGQPVSRLSVISELEKQGGKQALDSIISKDLIYQEANKRHIVISQKDIDGQLATIEKNVTGQGATLDQALQQQGMTKNDLISQIRLQLILQKILGNNVTVSDKEIADYIAANKDQLPTDSNPDTLKQQVKEQLQQQKEQQKIQDYITQLKNKAKINYFVSY